MEKRMLSLILALLLAAALCACGSQTESPAPTEAPAAPTASPAPAPAPASEETPGPETAPADAPPILPDAGLHPAEEKPAEDPEIAARRELALSFLDRDLAELIAELGEPLERSYAPSCLGGGEDGELVYEGFTVYTYREGDRETVSDVK